MSKPTSESKGPVRSEQLVWFKVAEPDELPEGRVKAVTCGVQTVCLTHFEGQYAALDNRCPHQGGPLGEGSIENGWLRCPWHGWDYHPLTGRSPGSFEDGIETFTTELRDDGVYVGFAREQAHVPTVADRMVETMVNWGVRWVFGMVGHSNLGLADAVRRVAEREPEPKPKPGSDPDRGPALRYIGIRHEGAAAFAISAYGKLTARPAAALAIAGPGATNLITGLWDANVDRAPAIALTGQVESQVLGRGAFQELPLQQAFGQVATFGHPVLRESNHVELMNLACKNALLERHVSHLIFPDEVQNIPAPELEPGSPEGRMPKLEITPAAESLTAAHERIRSAARPVIIVGYGAREDMQAITELAEQLHAPIVTTFKAKGQISDHHPLGCGVLGRSGTPIASWFMNESDLLIVCGSSFSNHTGITPKRPIVQIDWERSALGRVHPVAVPVWGAIAPTVAALRERLAGEGRGDKVDQRPEIAERWRLWREEKASRRRDDRGRGLSSALIFDALSRLVPDDAIIPVDVGNNAYAFGRYFECTRQRVLMSGYLGSIGFGLPAAMGAWAATREPDTPYAGRKVVSVSGDGGLGQYLAELTTLVKYGMNITHVLLDNNELAKISKEQRSGQWPVWETELVNPDFAAYAELCGALGISVRTADELDDALRRGLEHQGPSLVHIRADAALV